MGITSSKEAPILGILSELKPSEELADIVLNMIPLIIVAFIVNIPSFAYSNHSAISTFNLHFFLWMSNIVLKLLRIGSYAGQITKLYHIIREGKKKEKKKKAQTMITIPIRILYRNSENEKIFCMCLLVHYPIK